MAEDRLLSTGEAARALGLSSRSLARWAREGRITPALVTPGGQYRFRLEDLRRELLERPPADRGGK
jgi:excisionase family DNA binding protein